MVFEPIISNEKPVPYEGVSNRTFHLPAASVSVEAEAPQEAATVTFSPGLAQPQIVFVIFCCKIMWSPKRLGKRRPVLACVTASEETAGAEGAADALTGVSPCTFFFAARFALRFEDLSLVAEGLDSGPGSAAIATCAVGNDKASIIAMVISFFICPFPLVFSYVVFPMVSVSRLWNFIPYFFHWLEKNPASSYQGWAPYSCITVTRPKRLVALPAPVLNRIKRKTRPDISGWVFVVL
jgi:hypothetical protein